jgi:di/tricarboxylate transporter
LTTQTAYVACVLFVMCWLFVTERLRMNIVGFLTTTALVLGGVLTIPEALAGFSDPTVHMMASLSPHAPALRDRHRELSVLVMTAVKRNGLCIHELLTSAA